MVDYLLQIAVLSFEEVFAMRLTYLSGDQEFYFEVPILMQLLTMYYDAVVVKQLV